MSTPQQTASSTSTQPPSNTSPQIYLTHSFYISPRFLITNHLPSASAPPKDIFLHRRIASTCFGLTCKKLYAIHFNLHGKVSFTTHEDANSHSRHLWLHRRLENWAASLVYHHDMYYLRKTVREDFISAKEFERRRCYWGREV